MDFTLKDEMLITIGHMEHMIQMLKSDIKKGVSLSSIEHQRGYINMKFDQLNYFIEEDLKNRFSK